METRKKKRLFNRFISTQDAEELLLGTEKGNSFFFFFLRKFYTDVDASDNR